MIKVGILGLGYVGLTLAVTMAKHGVRVFGCDTNLQILASLKNCKAHFFEANIDEILKEVTESGLFTFTANLPAKVEYDCFIITVGTPLRLPEKSVDLAGLESAVESLRGIFDGSQLVILRSTVEVGVSRNVVLPLLAALAPETDLGELQVAFCPERTIEGKALTELESLPQIISGNSVTSIKSAEAVFNKIGSSCIKAPSLEGAELIKLFNNTYRDVQFAIGNLFNEIAQKFGLNGVEIIDIANKDYPRSNIAKPGLVGGPCLEKDPYILTANLDDSFGATFVRYARIYNESMEDQIIDWVIQNGGPEKLTKVLIMGMAFKGQPETSDLRGSNSVSIATKLKQHGFIVHTQDFCVPNSDLQQIADGAVDYSTSLGDKYPLILILNNHESYSQINRQWITENLTPNGKIFDCWNVLAKLEHPQVITLGELTIAHGGH